MSTNNNSAYKSEFILPINGRVVIIDDKIEEAIPLMNVLSKHHIPFTYFDVIDNLPEKPVDNARIIFLDIEIEGSTKIDDPPESIAQYFEEIFSYIIGETNYPYIIIYWAVNLEEDENNEKYKEITDKIREKLSPKPLLFLNLEKAKCKNTNGVYDLSIINNNLIKEINNCGSFRFFLEWENIIHESAGRTVNEISSIITLDDNWNQNINEILRMLAEAYAGQQAGNNFDLNAMLSINNLLLDIIENRIKNSKLSVISNQTVNLNNLKKIKGELNRRLLIANEQNNSVIPGNIYKNEFSIKCDIDNLCHNNNVPEELNNQDINIILELSPYCDYAQKKWICHRILPGVIWPEEHKNVVKKADYIYRTPLFLISGQLCFFVFDLRYFSSITFDSFKDKTSLYRFRKELLVDIQSKIAGHINRPGIIYAG